LNDGATPRSPISLPVGHARSETSDTMSSVVDDSTRLLLKSRSGDRAAFDDLFAQVYDELHRIAHGRLRRHRPGETLNTTGLVHEVFSG
jgi:hypothetical protein